MMTRRITKDLKQGQVVHSKKNWHTIIKETRKRQNVGQSFHVTSIRATDKKSVQMQILTSRCMSTGSWCRHSSYVTAFNGGHSSGEWWMNFTQFSNVLHVRPNCTLKLKIPSFTLTNVQRTLYLNKISITGYLCKWRS